MRSDTTELRRVSQRLRDFNGSQWTDFVKAFAAFADRAATECVEAPPDKLVAAQARAQQARALLEVFTTSTTKG